MTSRRNAIRYEGKITTWKDEQGFGFIAQNGGGPRVFVHVKSFTGSATRPAENDVVTYELTVNEKGQPRAANVAFVRDFASRVSPHRLGMSSLIAAFGFLGIVAMTVLFGKLPFVVFGAYVGMTVLAFVAYAIDKSAARNNRWRIKESTLHMLGVAGGWPGALVAQQFYRHKSKKPAFQAAFWFTVVVNCAVLGWLLSSSGANLLQTILGLPQLGQ
jgi:uncharacterized membrane protein YsdA (DUF1294 family)/cold shock CspA family protein